MFQSWLHYYFINSDYHCLPMEKKKKKKIAATAY